MPEHEMHLLIKDFYHGVSPINRITLHLKALARWLVGISQSVKKCSVQRNISKHLLNMWLWRNRYDHKTSKLWFYCRQSWLKLSYSKDQISTPAGYVQISFFFLRWVLYRWGSYTNEWTASWLRIIMCTV